MNRTFVDTSGWYAYVNAADAHHSRVGRAFRACPGRLVTSSYVFDELVTLCRYRLGHAIAVKAGALLLSAGKLDIVRITAEDERAAWALFQEKPDQPFSVTDCTSFVLMRRLGLTCALALDDDFAREGFELLPGSRAAS